MIHLQGNHGRLPLQKDRGWWFITLLGSSPSIKANARRYQVLLLRAPVRNPLEISDHQKRGAAICLLMSTKTINARSQYRQGVGNPEFLISCRSGFHSVEIHPFPLTLMRVATRVCHCEPPLCAKWKNWNTNKGAWQSAFWWVPKQIMRVAIIGKSTR